MPEVDPAKMRFAPVMALFTEMLSIPSAGAHEQYILAALLEARAEQAGAGQHVETKNLNASDQSASAAADIQVKTRTRTDEAFEVTANQWNEKVDGASHTIRTYDLSRIHIAARISNYTEMLRTLVANPDDISVLELHHLVAHLLAELRRTNRAQSLHRLYQMLDRLQSNTDLVNAFVGLLERHALVLPAADRPDA